MRQSEPRSNSAVVIWRRDDGGENNSDVPKRILRKYGDQVAGVTHPGTQMRIRSQWQYHCCTRICSRPEVVTREDLAVGRRLSFKIQSAGVRRKPCLSSIIQMALLPQHLHLPSKKALAPRPSGESCSMLLFNLAQRQKLVLIATTEQLLMLDLSTLQVCRRKLHALRVH